ncbi:MAG: thymidine kinase [Bacteroidota bacterium]|nr:thymidine kinase [Bacteroidota bacterium]MDP4211432.1 thymidine kinase [Bacteroidota bacterium]MDP4248659.1 thymidine kinase [Bacteroidota bacterium]
MFIEPAMQFERRGWVEVICGSMFSGKTEELIRRLRRAKIAKLRVLVFKPASEKRFHDENIVSHDESNSRSVPVSGAGSILEQAGNADVVGIDEAQFFDEQLPAVCDILALHGTRVIVAGLDMDFMGRPFGQMPVLLAKADYITKLHAICMQCGNMAHYTYKKNGSPELVELGKGDLYEPRCRSCYEKGELLK